MRRILRNEELYMISKPDSTFIDEVIFYFGFDHVTSEITEGWGSLVVTINDEKYEYRDFPLYLFMELANSESLGKFFNQRIRNVYYANTSEFWVSFIHSI